MRKEDRPAVAYPLVNMDAGASNGEINRELTALKHMFSLALEAGKLLAKPYIPMLREDNIRKGFFEPTAFEIDPSSTPR